MCDPRHIPDLVGPHPRLSYIAWARYRFVGSPTERLLEWWAPDLATARQERLRQASLLAYDHCTVLDAGITRVSTTPVEDAHGQELGS